MMHLINNMINIYINIGLNGFFLMFLHMYLVFINEKLTILSFMLCN